MPGAGISDLLRYAGRVGNIPIHAVEDAVANRIAVFISHIRTGPLILRHARQYQLEEGIFHYVELGGMARL